MAVLDVRPYLAEGQEHFPHIMEAVDSLKKGEHLVIVAQFEALSLVKLMKEKGFEHFSTKLPDGIWQVKFVNPSRSWKHVNK